MHILLVEDDNDLAASVSDYLTASGNIVDWAGRASRVQPLMDANMPDVIVLDLMLPDGDGIDLTQQIRQRPDGDIPILMLTARDTEQDKLDGFMAGADDYLVKPFSLAELQARLTAMHRRNHGARVRQNLCIDDLNLCRSSRSVSRAQQPITLKPVAFKILEYLMANSHRTVPRHELIENIWQHDAPDTDALRVHVHSLRKAIDTPGRRPLVHTIRGVGYRVTRL